MQASRLESYRLVVPVYTQLGFLLRVPTKAACLWICLHLILDGFLLWLRKTLKDSRPCIYSAAFLVFKTRSRSTMTPSGCNVSLTGSFDKRHLYLHKSQIKSDNFIADNKEMNLKGFDVPRKL